MIRRIVDAFFPRRCPICDRVLARKGQRVCPKCHKKLVYAGEPACMKCGKPLLMDSKEYCEDCNRLRHYFAQGRAVFVYNDAAKQSIYRFKYKNRREYAEFYMQEAMRLYAGWLKVKGITLLLPIPMYGPKKRKRGYNQADLLAKELSRLSGIPYRTDLLLRSRNTVPQKALTGQERKNNLKNAFKLSVNSVQLDKILLIDDIFTTGSTMDEAARLLLEAKASEVFALYVCIGQDY